MSVDEMAEATVAAPPAVEPAEQHKTASARRRGTRASNIIGPLAVLAVLIGLWYFMHHWGMRHLFDKNPTLVPPPHEVLYESFVRRVPQGDGSYYMPRNDLMRGLWGTMKVAALGLFIASVLGVSLAVLMRKRWVERSVWPYLVALQAIPVIAISPLLWSIFGSGMTPRVVVCVMLSIFPIVSNTLFGLKSVDRAQHDLFSIRQVSPLKRLFRLEFPSAMPSMFVGFRTSAGLSVIGAVVGEQFFRSGSGTGLGIVMEKFRSRSLWPQTYGALLLACLLGIAVFVILTWVAKLLFGRWHESAR